MSKPAKKEKAEEKVKTDMSFEELMKKALNTPLPKEEKKKKGGKKKPPQDWSGSVPACQAEYFKKDGPHCPSKQATRTNQTH